MNTRMICAACVLCFAANWLPACSRHGSLPSVKVGHPAVYTTIELELANQNMPSHARLEEGLKRYFATTQTDYEKTGFRLDSMLDNAQRSSAYYQAISTLTQLRVVANLLGTNAPANDAGARTFEGPDKAKALELIEKLFEQVSKNEATIPPDSPFDQLDRVTDFYTAYLIKYMRREFPANVGGYGRTPSLSALGMAAAEADACADKSNEERIPDRLIMLVLQAHVHPGAAEDYMAGLRMRICEAQFWKNSGPISDPTELANMIHILRVHPTRPYDLDDTAFAESIRDSIRLAGEVTAPLQGGRGDASASRDQEALSELRRNFISRISKQASFVDAGDSTLGWNFYPSNLEVINRDWLSGAVQTLLGRPGGKTIHAYLEGGARDCAVYLLVPHGLKSITFQTASVAEWVSRSKLISTDESFYPSVAGRDRARGSADFAGTSAQKFTIYLPEYSKLEATPSLAIAPQFRQFRDAGDSFTGKANTLLAKLNRVNEAGSKVEAMLRTLRISGGDALKLRERVAVEAKLKEISKVVDEMEALGKSAREMAIEPAELAELNDILVVMEQRLDTLRGVHRNDPIHAGLKERAGVEFTAAKGDRDLISTGPKVIAQMQKMLGDAKSIKEDVKKHAESLKGKLGLVISETAGAVGADGKVILYIERKLPNDGWYELTIKNASIQAIEQGEPAVLEYKGKQLRIVGDGRVVLQLHAHRPGVDVIIGGDSEKKHEIEKPDPLKVIAPPDKKN